MVMLTVAARDAATVVWSAIRSRNLIGSDIAIVLTCFQHVYFAALFLSGNDANGSIGMASLLLIFYRPWIAAFTLLGVVCFAVLGEWTPELSRLARFALLFPQMAMLFITGIGAILFVLAQHYADCATLSECVFRSWRYISADQIDRIGMPVWYASAIVARVRE